MSGMEVELRWRDNSDRETEFAVFLQGPSDPRPRAVRSVAANATSVAVDDLVPGVTYRFAVEALNGKIGSGRTPMAAATTWADARLHLEAEGEIVSEDARPLHRQRP